MINLQMEEIGGVGVGVGVRSLSLSSESEPGSKGLYTLFSMACEVQRLYAVSLPSIAHFLNSEL
jgi:hypothetical protein